MTIFRSKVRNLNAFEVSICFVTKKGKKKEKEHEASYFQYYTILPSSLSFSLIILQQRHKKTILIGPAFCWHS